LALPLSGAALSARLRPGKAASELASQGTGLTLW